MKKRILPLVFTLCLALAAMVLLCACASAASANDYRIEVDITNQITTVFRRSDNAIVRQMICSTGTGDRTPRGVFKLEATRASTDRKPWYYITNYRCYVKYATRIKGSILFHSIPYSDKSLDSIDRAALCQLGVKASHGCIRLNWEDAHWIACNCPDGTTVKIYNGAAQKKALRKQLLREGFTITRGKSYEQFIDARLETKGMPELSLGSTGDRVVALQEGLTDLGLLPGGATGLYDGATAVAVMRYQAHANRAITSLASGDVIDDILAESEMLRFPLSGETFPFDTL